MSLTFISSEFRILTCEAVLSKMVSPPPFSPTKCLINTALLASITGTS